MVNRGLCPSVDHADTGHWRRWHNFCAKLAIDSLLHSIEDPIALLHVFAAQYRKGLIAPSGKPVKGQTVKGALRVVGETKCRTG